MYSVIVSTDRIKSLTKGKRYSIWDEQLSYVPFETEILLIDDNGNWIWIDEDYDCKKL